LRRAHRHCDAGHIAGGAAEGERDADALIHLFVNSQKYGDKDNMNILNQAFAMTALACAALSAVAQDNQSVNPNSALGSEVLGSRAAPIAPGPILPPGPLSELGDHLRDAGVNVGATLIDINSRNPSTGITPHSMANYGFLFATASFDLDKIFGLHATEFNITEVLNRPYHRENKYLFDTGSGFTPFPVINTASDLANLTLSNRLLDDRLKLTYGRLNLNNDFIVGNMCGGCIISAPANVLSEPGLSKSSWGGIGRYDLDARSAVGLGVTEDNPKMWQNTNGWEWHHDTAVGYIAIANYTQRRTFDDSRFPYKLETGVFHSSASYDDPLYNQDGTTQTENSSGTPLQHKGRWGGYFQGRKVYWRAGEPDSNSLENLAGYAGLVVAPGVGESYPVEAYAGTEWSNFAASNPLAMVGATVRYMELGERRAEYEQQVRAGYTTGLNAASGGVVPVVNEAVPRNMFLFDVHGRVGLLPGIFVESSLQYLKNPNALIPATPERVRNGYMFNVSLVVDFGVLSGLARIPGDKIF
jgi:porin